MRVALLADVHANLAALEATVAFVDEWKPDAVVVAGDVINRGPRPAECLALIRARVEAGWRILRGNHEDYVLREADLPQGRPEWEQKLCQHSIWTLNQVRAGLPAVAAWPDEVSLEGPQGTGLRFLHASRLGNRAGLYATMTNEEMASRVDRDCDVFGVGHTHCPFLRQVGRALVVNAGAVGMPFDRDARSSLALLEHRHEGWQARIHRLPYDRARTDRDFHESGYLTDGGPMTPLIYHEFQQARPRLGEWHRLFEQLVRAEHLTIEDSVAEMLNAP